MLGYSNVEVGGASQEYEMTFKNIAKLRWRMRESTHGQDIYKYMGNIEIMYYSTKKFTGHNRLSS